MSKPKPTPADAKVESIEPLVTSLLPSAHSPLTKSEQKGDDARWTKLVKITYRDPTGQQRTWESAERSTRPPNSAIDGVGIVAILQTPTGPEILLQKQFRPPTDKVCIEVPAGLIDAGETPEECAVRELREETGYVGVAQRVERSGGIGAMFNARAVSKDEGGGANVGSTADPGFTNTNLCMIHVAIDTSRPENRPENLKPELEENEFIEVFSVPLRELWEECQRLEGEGYAIDARVGTLAEGVELARKWGL
ncbi:hypothetical protein MMC32_005039 [Xylographa parallela]|nr:hypothetical protein [Xylographa parallela]